MADVEHFPCPCCGYLVFTGPPGTYDVCPICAWEDDASQLRFPKLEGGANGSSFLEAQKHFLDFGVSDIALLSSVRPPLPQEKRDAAWRPMEAADLPRDAHGVAEGEQATYPSDFTELYYWRRRYR
jgi:hypothetical protein